MAWLRMTDTAAMHPIVLAVDEHELADDRTVDEVFGFMTRLATTAAQYEADYVVAYPQVRTLAGSRERADRLLAQAQFAGYGVQEVDDVDGRRRWRFVNDPEFLHMRTKEELDFERQRKIDNSNVEITAPVRARDGDVCRYCGRVVRFDARRGRLRGTYDHRPPGKPAAFATMVVACGQCNARRGDRPLKEADAEVPLLAAPVAPYYHRNTREWLHDHRTELEREGLVPPPLAPDQHDTKQGDPAPGAQAAPVGHGERRATGDPQQAAAPTRQRAQAAAEAPSRRPAAPSSVPVSDPGRSRQNPSIRIPEASGRDGTGRYGPLREGTGRSPSPPGTNPRRRRGSRGGRSRSQQGDQ